MIKYSFYVLGVYVLYYAGNIVYDLFLKKVKTVQTDVTEEFSIGDYAENNRDSVKQVGIDDVENLNTPNSFHNKELHAEMHESVEEVKPEIEDLRKRFEAEEDLDDSPQEDPEESKEFVQPVSIKKEEGKPKKSNWEEIMELSETTVQLVANYQGYKVYQSIM